ncbi:MAG: hypothetical protein LKH33_09815 [Acetobacter sp.]|jgi:hypothetical protein|nr:hypothetical protein [Acetobacter sp.]MCH4061871.1 hypothetical protein [Acetobacter sp.]MCH4089280.1 hypothetical protein [Acetobacter sp.]MCI1294488.1 hypothetical protein [Acetobacter sp.]MCI1321226.1 hypothetical protein [Acetobacter sp.]
MRIFEAGRSTLDSQIEVIKFSSLRVGKQVALLIIAAVFGFFALISGHALLWAIFLFEFHFGPVCSPAAVFGCDVLAALIFILFGRRSYVTPAEMRARVQLDRHLSDLRQTITLSTILATFAGPIGRYVGSQFFSRKR